MARIFTSVDLDGLPREAVEELRELGDEARVWTHLRMAAVRDPASIPSQLVANLSTPPREMNKDRCAIIDGLERLLVEATAHREASAPNGNARLAGVPELASTTYPMTGSSDRFGVARTRPTRLGWMAAVNLSVGIGSPGTFDRFDPVNIASSRAVEHMPLVMAAGNARKFLRGPHAFSRWARAPWMVSVTALRDGTLAEDSAYGEPDNPSSWPTIAAPDDLVTILHLDTGIVDAHRGTSIAAPVVTRQIAKLTAFVLTVRACILESRGVIEGVPRVGCGLVDFDIDIDRLSVPSWPFGALPLAGVDWDGAARLGEVAAEAGLDVVAFPEPAALRRLLVASAREVEGLGPHQVGAGEVSPGTTAVYLAQLQAGDYLRALLGDNSLVQSVASTLDEVPLSDDSLTYALTAWDSSEYWWLWDFREAVQIFGLTLSTDQEVLACSIDPE